VGENWGGIRWRVNVSFSQLANKIRPKDHMGILRAVLPNRYSPLQPSGKGLQSVYLTELAKDFAEVLGGLIGGEVCSLIGAAEGSVVVENQRIVTGDNLDVWEHRLEQHVESDTSLAETDREAIVRARRGQGLFKQRVMRIEARCRLTGVENPNYLLASHCKPWRDSSNDERLNGENGLLLTVSIDHLFDRRFIGFEDSGDLIISPVAHKPSLQKMGVEPERIANVGSFTDGQRRFLNFTETPFYRGPLDEVLRRGYGL
jgi:putative restriction endonuclease